MSIVDRVKDVLVEWMDAAGERIGFRYVSQSLPGPESDDARETVLDVPGYCQTQSYTCGFTAGLMILHTFHPRRSAERFLRTVAPDPAEGTPSTRLVSALRGSRVGVRWLRSLSFEVIAQHIEAGEPLLAVVNNGASYEHWVVVYGVRRGRSRRVYVAANGLPRPFDKSVYTWREFRGILQSQHGAWACWGE